MIFHRHFVSSKWIKVDLQKVEAVKKWPRPMTPTDIRSFLVSDTIEGLWRVSHLLLLR